MNIKRYIFILLVSSLVFTTSIQRVKADDSPYQNVKWGFNSQDELVVSFDWVGISRNNVAMAIGLNGRTLYSGGILFFPDSNKDVTAVFEDAINPNPSIPGWFTHGDFVQGQHYETPVFSLKKWTPENFVRACNWNHPCPITKLVAEEVIGRPFNNGDYITIAFDANNPTPIQFSDPTQYYFVGEQKTPIIIVPGIMGTRLSRADDNEEVWPGGLKLLSISDNHLDELALDKNGNEIIDIKTVGIIEEELGEKFYKDLVRHFTDNGYIIDENLFTVPYDWRFNIASSTDIIENVTLQAVLKSSTGKVNIITHSMGGILFQEYLANITDLDFINKWIVLGMPKFGSIKAFKALSYGDDFDMKKLGFGLNGNKVKEITQNMPAVYQLLPSRKYIQENGSYVKDTRNKQNIILDYDQTKSFMVSNSRNELLLNIADQFHQEFDDTVINIPEIYNIIGCRNPETPGGIILKDKGKFTPKYIKGDGTVSLGSADSIPNAKRVYYTGVGHTELPGDSNVIALINNILSENPDASVQNISQDESFCSTNLPEKFIFSSHSPVNLHVYDSQNRHLGLNADGDIELGIPDSDYMTIEHNNFAFVPAGDTYRVVLEATDVGEFDLEIEHLGDTGEIENKVTYLDVPLSSTSTKAELNFSDFNDIANLNLDLDGDTTFETTILPSGILDQVGSQDATSPRVSVISPGSRDYLRSELAPVDINMQDAESGVAFLNVSLDGKLISSTTPIDLFFKKLGNHNLGVEVSDRAGNPVLDARQFRIIATPDSTISDIERAYALGWISKEGIKKELITKLNRIIKIEKRIEVLEEKLPNNQKVLKRIEKLEKKIDKILGERFLKELGTFYEKGRINIEAYQLLKEDIEWLLSN